MKFRFLFILALGFTVSACTLPFARYSYVPVSTSTINVSDVVVIPLENTKSLVFIITETPSAESIFAPMQNTTTSTQTIVVLSTSLTQSPTPTASSTLTGTATRTPSATLTRTFSPTSTLTVTGSISPGTPTHTPSSTTTRTLTRTPTSSRTSTPFTPTQTHTRTPTRTPTKTATLTNTRTSTYTLQPTTPPPPSLTYTHTFTALPATPTFTRIFTNTYTSTVLVPSLLPPTVTFTRTVTPVPPTATTSVCNPVQNSGFESQVIALINNERANAGVAPLNGQSQLGNAARGHSQDMACNGFFSHTGSDGSTFAVRITRAGYSYSAAAENIAAGYGDPASVVAGWMGSQGHKDNMLNPNYTEVGIGYVYVSGSPYGVYWTANFGRP